MSVENINSFVSLSRQKFRRYYQPSRIVLGVVPSPLHGGLNVITLCFNMHCSYKPPMVAFSVQKTYFSYHLFLEAKECVLAVPGENLVEETLYCGTRSGRDIDKVKECNFTLCKSGHVVVPGLERAVANIEIAIEKKIETGDHLTVIGLVKKFGLNQSVRQRNLLSVGPDHEGYEVLARKGIHRIAVAKH